MLKSNKKQVPVITIDGPSGSGKGTVALRIARTLGWYVLDSGIIYRAIAWALLYYNISLSDTDALSELLKRVQISIKNHPNEQIKVSCDGYDVTRTIRSKECSIMASKASALFLVRSTILQYQRNFRCWPGLVADGRDMGTVIFPDAPLKFFFNADLSRRIYRRYKQLQEQGINVSLPDIRGELEERDLRDSSRSISPTKPASDAVVIDTTSRNADGVFALVMNYIKQRGLDKQA